MAIYGYTKNYKLIKPQFDTDTWHDYMYDNLDTIDAVLSAIFASGDWQGFWKSNTHYNVGGVVIDRDTDTMYKVMVEHTTSEATFAEELAAHPTYYELWSPNNLAEDWAIKMDGVVSNVDYSSKAYAISTDLIDSGSAQEWAIKSGAIGTTGEYSAKKYATDAHNDYISMTTDANVVAVGTNITNVNTVSSNISDVNTTATNVSSVNTVAGNISRVGLVADDISSVHTVAIDISNVIDVAANKTNIDTVATNISDVNTAATNIAAIQAAPTAASNAATSANNASIWAEGTDAQVQALGGTHSSKVWAEQSTNANIALTNSPYTTNRILEIPQDIKLELNNGTLTLKAGSKVYVPNGFEADGTTPKFDVKIIENDNSTTNTQPYNYKYIMLYNIDTTEFYSFYESVFFSGPTQPVGYPICVWYDTNNNIIKLTTDSFSTWTKVCFPLGIIQQSSSGVTTAIDQIFNGFGYIGSTMFVLPGVKVQTPNGKNADGTYKSVIRTIDSVRTYDAGAWGTRNLNVQISGSIVTPYFEGQAVERFTYNKKFSSETTTYSYDENTGIWWYSSNQSSWLQFFNNIVGTCRVENGKITSFEPYTVDSVLNSNEFYQLKDKVVTTDTAQTISGVKTFNANTIVKGSGAGNGIFTIKNDVTTYGTSAVDLVVATENGKNQLFVHFQEGNKWCAFFDQDPSTKNITFSLAPCAAVYAPTPAVASNGGDVATTAWFNSKMQVVSALPANPDPNVFYFIPE